MTEEQYILCMEKIYDKVVKSNRLTIQECKELENNLQAALQYKNVSIRDKENFIYHQQHMQEYYDINKKRIKDAILYQQAQIRVCKNRIAELERQLV